MVDWHRFLGLVGQARTARSAGDEGDAAELLRRALAMWRGSALADVPADSLGPLRTRMDTQRLAAAEDLAGSELALGRAGDVIELLTDLALREPARERLAALLIDALRIAGRRDDAVAVYRRTAAPRRFTPARLGATCGWCGSASEAGWL